MTTSTNLPITLFYWKKREQSGKLAKSINHFHLLQTIHTKILSQLYLMEKMELSFHAHIISIERTCWIRPSEWTTLRANKRPEARELRRENLTGSIRTWQLLVIWLCLDRTFCFTSLYFHKNDFSIPTLTYACARQ